MKKNVLSFVSGMVAMLLLVGLPVTALAASGAIRIEVSPISVLVDGEVFQPSSSQATYRSPRRVRQGSFTPLLLLSKPNPLHWASVLCFCPLRALAEAYGLEVGYDGERHIATVSKQPTQTQAPIADTGYAGFEKQWTVKEKPVTHYGNEKIFTVTYSGDLSRSDFKAWRKSYDLSTIKEYAERMMAAVQSEVSGYTVTAYFSYGQYNLGSVHAESDFTGSNFDAAGVWIK